MPVLSGFILPVAGSVFKKSPVRIGMIARDSSIALPLPLLSAISVAFENLRKEVVACIDARDIDV